MRRQVRWNAEKIKQEGSGREYREGGQVLKVHVIWTSGGLGEREHIKKDVYGNSTGGEVGHKDRGGDRLGDR